MVLIVVVMVMTSGVGSDGGAMSVSLVSVTCFGDRVKSCDKQNQ